MVYVSISQLIFDYTHLRKICCKISDSLLFYLLFLMLFDSVILFINDILGISWLFPGFDFKIFAMYSIYLLLGFIINVKFYHKGGAK